VKIVGWQSHNLYSDFGGLYANKASAGFAPPVRMGKSPLAHDQKLRQRNSAPGTHHLGTRNAPTTFRELTRHDGGQFC
jgi:hypothetical protein